MAPEQFRGSATPASDLYALGAIVLFLASGEDQLPAPSTASLSAHSLQGGSMLHTPVRLPMLM